MDLIKLRWRVGLLTLGFLWLLVLAVAASAWVAGQNMLIGPALAIGLAAVATAVGAFGPGAPVAQITTAAATVCSISVLVWVTPALFRIDMHMTYFAALALMAGFCDRRPILVATGVTAVHHLGLDLLAPLAVFPDTQYGLLRVAVHAAILLLEAGALLLVATGIERAALAAVEEAQKLADQARTADQSAHAAQRQSDLEAQARSGRHAWAGRLEADLGDVATQVAASAGTLTETASRLGGLVQDASNSAEAASLASQSAGSNAQTVAGAIEALAASISEITHQVGRAIEIAERAVRQARETDVTVGGLAEGAQRIGDVVRLISEIAAQTNLLALNATIEAARAGEAGRGFAVVAGEVKSLAAQTARATEEIGQQINGIRATTEKVVTAVRGFGSVVTEIEQVAGAIAGAVGEQRGAAQESAVAAADISQRTTDASTAVDRAAAAFARAADVLGLLEQTSADLAGSGTALRERIAASLKELAAA